jgi:hypothetical protein
VTLVPLDELADRLGVTTNPAEYVLARGVPIVVDWKGAAAVTEADARSLVDDSRRRGAGEDP